MVGTWSRDLDAYDLYIYPASIFYWENTSESFHKVVVTEHQTIHTPSVDNTEVGSLNLVIRKATHITVFGILAFLLFKSLEINRFSYIFSWFLTVLYAISDEYH